MLKIEIVDEVLKLREFVNRADYHRASYLTVRRVKDDAIHIRIYQSDKSESNLRRAGHNAHIMLDTDQIQSLRTFLVKSRKSRQKTSPK